MSSKPRRDPDRKWETHVYMTEQEKTALQKAADLECRSLNGQILHYIRQGLNRPVAKSRTA